MKQDLESDFRRLMLKWFGKKCKEFERTCIICQAWRDYERLINRWSRDFERIRKEWEKEKWK
jgi:hypothetical protein